MSWIGKALNDPSALLKHELAYCLGQMQNPSAIPILIKTLEDKSQGKYKTFVDRIFISLF